MLYKSILIKFILFFIFFNVALSQEYLLFGERNHDKFLGCLNCSKYDSGSICNKYGNFGGKYSGDSIFNKYGTYGSKYNGSSPWNRYSTSTEVPVLVDRSGKFYGYFTINSYRSDAFSNSRNLKEIFENANGDYELLQKIVCDVFSK